MSDAASGTLWAVMNPAARGYAVMRRVLETACRDAGLPAPVIATTTPEADGYPQVHEAVAQGARAVVVAGGDGTLREAARALAGTGVELGILPIGTANLFAYNLRLRTRKPLLAVDRALFAPARSVDIGWASWRVLDERGHVGEPTPEMPFLVMAGLGHDAATVGATSPRLKQRLGWLSYLASGTRHLFSRPLAMRVSLNNAPGRRLTTWTLLVANAGRSPAGSTCSPTPSSTTDASTSWNYRCAIAPSGAPSRSRASPGTGSTREPCATPRSPRCGRCRITPRPSTSTATT
ncbi:diacylglycerol/lipid kinase family protein [Propioniciclava flava]